MLLTPREREYQTLTFKKPEGGGSPAETFFPWDKTVLRWLDEGFPAEKYPYKNEGDGWNKKSGNTLCTLRTNEILHYESFFGLAPVARINFGFPLKKDCISSREDWEKEKELLITYMDEVMTEENITQSYGHLISAHQRGDITIRLRVHGWFWSPRVWFGDANHMFALYDYPDVIHDMGALLVRLYKEKMGMLLDILPADVLLICEDLSGKNGPMLSAEHFDEYVGDYYRQVIPFFKKKGVRSVFVDTDGDFRLLIPNFMNAGVEGFLPMDVNAGMDIVQVRKDFPGLRFIGAFNKLEIDKGPAAIDAEFERLRPVIEQGGYMPGCDHQVAPSCPLINYQYYVKRLKEEIKGVGKHLSGAISHCL